MAESVPVSRRRRGPLLVAVAVAVALGATSTAALAEPIPAATVTPLGGLPSVVPGTPPQVPWPAEGEAAMVTSSGVSFGGSGAPGAVPIASVTKIMTAYVVLGDHPLAAGQSGPELTVSAADAATLPGRLAEGQSLLEVTAGEQLSELQALDALLIPSADNIADLLAVYDAGSIPAFVAKMNAAAAALGLAHTHYADASGLDPASASTPDDQIVLARAALRLPAFAAIVDQPSVSLPVVGTVTNYNTLAGHYGFDGVKTGSTGPAGGCLVFSATRTVSGTPVTVIGAVLGQRDGPYVAAAVTAARALTDAAFASLTRRRVLAAGTPVVRITRAGQQVTAVTTAPLWTIDPAGTPVDFTLRPAPPGPATATAASLTLHAPGTDTTSPVEPRVPLPPPTLTWRIEHLW
jgi:D-alanyl-D-alanine carboxypeptidase (penicillin-binding protein 5/6)